MRTLRSKDGDLLSHFDKIDEFRDGVENTSLHYHFINNHGEPANKGKTKSQLPLEHKFGFCQTFKKLTK